MMSKAEFVNRLLLPVVGTLLLLWGLAALGERDSTASLVLIALGIGAWVWRYRRRAAAKRVKALEIGARALGCTVEEFEALIIIERLKGGK
jgi:hypothetical protein